ncbi:BTB/POZ and MATH domain-containing protein 2-like [Syzygium oleosum]|uniref:BTB/POZ and MATH domain-containing protein 2-like n=1 Tax=Syzygium oleosum TaxID=219896 RepID=UPI0024BB4259|nr:BTB/POZ and MATH domain-containing protein 2-like [Syzygium oleosum]
MYDEADHGITTEYTDVSPAHYVFKIESFSLFSENDMDMYETNEFESGGHKWRMILYPNGDESRNGQGHVSIYLAVSETSPLKVGSDVNAIVRFFVFDQIRHIYLVKQGISTRLRAMSSKWGIPRYVPLEIFKDRSYGFLVDCIFGVEVFVIKNSGIDFSASYDL